ncbi:putative LRR receptor-like serine/threonine-protein kinase [Morus notabilis]|uniref:non-specific serine/threonine protein kinase n=1 Tax=Morus notabilis TaxID=981085 RepID=W9S8A0_9ROSA|nr:probable LRR receptor-like serine/threonine-protein kinase At3g47570 [Morus notabilis]EXC19951.1 putative LRR receptor-like serine/threonine-protein kinase [Morus notabilis]
MGVFRAFPFRASLVFLLLIRVLDISVSVVPGNETDRLALLSIKTHITEDPYRITSSWNDSVYFCRWQGVSCGHKHQRVTQLNLRSLSLKGSLSPYIGNLSFLRVIDLSNNSFNGELPNEIGRLFRLQEFVLERNLVGGHIPIGLSNCSRLRILNLGFNEFIGDIPFELGFLPKLVRLKLLANKLKGSIPHHLGNISSLQQLNVSANKLEGNIPGSLGNLKSLISLSLSYNKLSGMVPPSIYNLSNLEALVIAENHLQGSFPHDVGLSLPNIEIFRVWGNQLSGSIPVSLSNFSKLLELDISENNFSGGLPAIFGNMKNLMWVDISGTNLGSGKVNDLDFLTSFTNCSNLILLELQNNNFGGSLPNSIGNFSAQLEILSLEANRISGNIPPSVGNLMSLNALILNINQLTGTIPTTIGKLHNLVKLYLGSNQLFGEIPSSFGNLTLLNELRLEENYLHGRIPSSIRNCQHLQLLHLYSNSLSGTIPPEVIGLPSLSLSVDLSGNRLSGPLPSEIGNLKFLQELLVFYNQLTGDIPSRIGECESLRWVYMDHNNFSGSIESLHSLKGIEHMDLSHNNLSGHIPKEFAEFVFLVKLDLSFNDLEGEVPSGRIFSNVSGDISLAGNNKLCGGMAKFHLVPCSRKSPRKHHFSFTRKLIISIVCGLVGVLLTSYFLVLCCMRKNKKQASKTLSRDFPFLNISYGELQKATNGFCPENLIGVGGFGSVYKGVLEPHQLSIAVKVFNLQRRGASKSFKAECETLRNIRHRNLVKIITACSSIDFQGNDFNALVYEFMPNGSLEDWLHPYPQTLEEQRKSLSLSQRLNIVTDVASALDYLHNDNELPIIHCDLKPRNILLDQDMTAHVGDFGLSRIIANDNVQTSQNHISSSVGVRGTIGYVAPEYGMGSKVSTEGDVYSFGILLLEILTAKNPTNESLEGLSLHEFVKMAFPKRMMEIVDQSLLTGGEEEASCSRTKALTRSGKAQECLISIFTIGLKCSEELPRNRMKINDAFKDLQKVKDSFSKM